jgi:PAS domain-containing protein
MRFQRRKGCVVARRLRMGQRSPTTKPTRRVRTTITTKTATPVVAGDPPEVERIPPDDGDLARLLNAPEWEVIGALEALFEAATESIAIYDLEGRIVRANAAFYAAAARLFPGDLPVKLRDRVAQQPLRNPQGLLREGVATDAAVAWGDAERCIGRRDDDVHA